MQIFIDTINLNEIISFSEYGLIDGVTTNPSLLAQNSNNFIETIQSLCAVTNGPVSVEVIATEYNAMLKEAMHISHIAKNIVVKLPLTWAGLKVCKYLSNENIPTNITLCFSGTQALLAAKAGATYISPFIGRLDDIAFSGIKLIEEIKIIFNNYNIETKIIAASIRNSEKVLEAAKIGVDVITLPSQVLKQMISHPLTDIGLEKFLKDWSQSGLSL